MSAAWTVLVTWIINTIEVCKTVTHSKRLSDRSEGSYEVITIYPTKPCSIVMSVPKRRMKGLTNGMTTIHHSKSKF